MMEAGMVSEMLGFCSKMTALITQEGVFKNKTVSLSVQHGMAYFI
jgi:hypothetical protein